MNKTTGKFSIPIGKHIEIIIKSICDTNIHFISALETHENNELKNEKQFTQEFTTQNQIQINKAGFGNLFRIKDEYSDNFYKTKGVPDFAFLPLQEGISHEPLFIVEAKILPTPNISKKREETEYVYYKNPEKYGGIERFKTEKHGKGVSQCGMLAFIKSENYKYWFTKVNEWIEDATLLENSNWDKSEKLFNQNLEFNFHKSKVIRESSVLELSHFWVRLESRSKK